MSDRDDLAWVINRVAYNGRPDDTEPSGMDYEFADAVIGAGWQPPNVSDERHYQSAGDEATADLLVCLRCGALVARATIHDGWHARLSSR